MRNRKSLWTMDKQGNLVFPLREAQLNGAYTPDSKWEHPYAAIIIMLVCGTLDYVVFKSTFSSILYDAVWLQRLSVIGFLVAFDLAPIYLGILVKKSSQGMKVSTFAVITLSTAFALALVGNVWLRITIKDILVPADSVSSTSIFSSSTSSTDSNSAALPYAIVSSILPLATSIVSFVASYMSSNPLRDKLKKLREKQVELEDAIGQLEAVVEEYDEETDYKARLLDEDDSSYENAVRITQELGFMYADYVRERIKEHLGDAAATNELSKDCRDRLSKLFNMPSTGKDDGDTLADNQAEELYSTKPPITKEAA